MSVGGHHDGLVRSDLRPVINRFALAGQEGAVGDGHYGQRDFTIGGPSTEGGSPMHVSYPRLLSESEGELTCQHCGRPLSTWSESPCPGRPV